MIILKLFIVILLTLFIWLMLQLVLSAARVFSFFKYGLKQAQTNNRPVPGQTTMVKCSTCNLYLLDSDAVSHNGKYFCSLEHAKTAYGK